MKFQSSKGESEFKNPLNEIPSTTDIAATQMLRSKLGQQLQSIRRLSSKTDIYQGKLKDHADKVSKRKVFISYAHDDGKKFVLELADKLLERNCSPWVDSLAIPTRKKKGKRKRFSPDRLLSLLQFGIRDSALFVGLVTNNYTRKKKDSSERWTLKEWNIAREMKRNAGEFQLIQISDSEKKLPGCDILLQNAETNLLTESILTVWEK